MVQSELVEASGSSSRARRGTPAAQEYGYPSFTLFSHVPGPRQFGSLSERVGQTQDFSPSADKRESRNLEPQVFGHRTKKGSPQPESTR